MPNSSKKFTSPLFESICVLEGEIQNPAYHISRFQHSYHAFFGKFPEYGLLDAVAIPEEYRHGKVKLRIAYGKEGKTIAFQPYEKKEVNTLKLIEDNHIAYALKYEDRSPLNSLLGRREDCDDILIVKNGQLTDSSYANIVFFDGYDWYTPAAPLLKGTMRARLLEEGILKEVPIGIHDLSKYKGFQLINAMLGFDHGNLVSIANIRH